MAGIYGLTECQYSPESAFAEATSTYATLIPVKGIRLDTQQDRIEDGTARSRMNDAGLTHPGARSGTLEFTSYWGGHGGSTWGALSETWLQDLLSDGLGGGDVTEVGGQVGSSSGPTQITASTATLVVGGICRVGSKGDGYCDGQAAVVTTWADGSGTLLTALPGTPQALDKVYAAQIAYPHETTARASKRFLVGWPSSPTAGQQYHIKGADLGGLSLSLPIGGMPELTLRYPFAYWDRSAVTIPSASPAISACNPAPIAGGSVFINDVGTSTRATIVPSEMELSIDLGLEPQLGPGGVGTYQHIVGWTRTKCVPTLTMTIPWVSTYETWWDTSNASIAYKHILVTLNAADGKSVGFYLPRCMPIGPRPSVPSESNRQTYVRVQFRGVDGATTTSELTQSAIRFFAA